jgi:hypothetical protein
MRDHVLCCIQYYADDLMLGRAEADRLRSNTWIPVVDTDSSFGTDTPFRAPLYLQILGVSASSFTLLQQQCFYSMHSLICPRLSPTS